MLCYKFNPIGITLGSRQIHQSILALLIISIFFFSHSEHFTQVEFDASSTFDKHDCHVCQQGIDSPPASLEVKQARERLLFIISAYRISAILTFPDYIYPLLRAPPSFLLCCRSRCLHV